MASVQPYTHIDGIYLNHLQSIAPTEIHNGFAADVLAREDVRTASQKTGNVPLNPACPLAYRRENDLAGCVDRGIHQHGALWLNVDSNAVLSPLRLTTDGKMDDLGTVVEAPTGIQRGEITHDSTPCE